MSDRRRWYVVELPWTRGASIAWAVPAAVLALGSLVVAAYSVADNRLLAVAQLTQGLMWSVWAVVACADARRKSGTSTRRKDPQLPEDGA